MAFVMEYNNNISTNQAFYSQVSWGRLEMKPHEKKTGTEQERKRRGKQRAIKKPNQKEKRQ
jgi:hypothetical protein